MNEKRALSKKVHYSPQELNVLEKNFKRSCCQTMGQYLRDITLQRPIKIRNRDESFERFLDEASSLRDELQAVREKFDGSSPEALTQLFQLEQQIKSILNKIFDLCMQL